MKYRWGRLYSDDLGATMVEYGLLLSLIAVLSGVIVSEIGTAVVSFIVAAIGHF